MTNENTSAREGAVNRFLPGIGPERAGVSLEQK